MKNIFLRIGLMNESLLLMNFFVILDWNEIELQYAESM